MTDKRQKGGMLLEALAVLGLLTVTAPIVYKKAVESSKEIEDISVASQMRTIRDAAAVYIEKNYETLQNNEKINLTDLRRYLPTNFLENMNKNLANLSDISPNDPNYYEKVNKKINEAMTILVRKDQTTVSGENARPIKRASAYIVSNTPAGGKNTVDEKRGNRIAALIGAEGGYITDEGVILGSNNAWKKDSADLGLTVEEGQIVAGTSFSKDPMSGDFLYRNSVEGFPQFNMMMTNLDLNGSSIERIASLGFKYHHKDKYNSLELKGETGEFIGKRYEKNKEDTKITMKTSANKDGSGSFEVFAGNTEGCARADSDYDGNQSGGLIACNKDGKDTAFLVSAEGEKNDGLMKVLAGGESEGATIAHSNYLEEGAVGGAFEVKNASGATTALLTADQDNSSKMKLYNALGDTLNAEMQASENGGSIKLGDNTGNINKNNDAETVLADGETASITSKKTDAGYARLEARYRSIDTKEGASGGALLVAASGKNGTFALNNNAITAILANQNNISGYLRLNSGNFNSERIKISSIQRDGNNDGGSMYVISTDEYINTPNVVMEANRKGKGAGYMEFSNHKSSSVIDSDYDGSFDDNGDKNTSAFLAFDDGKSKDDMKIRLSSMSSFKKADKKGGLLDLTEKDGASATVASYGKSVFDESNQGAVINLKDNKDKVTFMAKGMNDSSALKLASNTKSEVSIFSGYANYADEKGNTDTSSMYISNDGGTKVIRTYADYKTDNGSNDGTIRVLSNSNKGGVDLYGKSSEHFTEKDEDKGGGVAVAKKSDGKSTAWLIANGPNKGGWVQLSDEEKDKGKVDLYASSRGQGGSGYLFDMDKKASVTIYSKYDGGGLSKESTPDKYKGISNRAKYEKYATAEADNANVSKKMNATEIYAKGNISVAGKLYASALCIGLDNNENADDEKRIDSITADGKKQQETLQAHLGSNAAQGSQKCLPLPTGGNWKDILYEAVIGTLESKYALRGHGHAGFAEYDHTQDYVDDNEHHEKAEGKTEWKNAGEYFGQSCSKFTFANSYDNTSYCCSTTPCDSYSCGKDDKDTCWNTCCTESKSSFQCCSEGNVTDQSKSYFETIGISYK